MMVLFQSHSIPQAVDSPEETVKLEVRVIPCVSTTAPLSQAILKYILAGFFCSIEEELIYKIFSMSRLFK
jgi:hypothetical protein